jgi:UDP-galactopyranose mutase
MVIDKEILVVGAGFAGAVCAERLAGAGYKVLVIDRRTHIAGNAYDECDSHNVLVHRYGPHIFHTNSKRVFEYLSRFTDWRFYEHHVLAQVDGELYPIPINRTTINRLYALNLTEAEMPDYLAKIRVQRDELKTSEDAVLAAVGPDLCEKFFRNYTKKQWDLDLSQLSASVAARVPVRLNDDDRYFADTFQFMPSEGYTQLFQRLLSNPNINVQLGVSYTEIASRAYKHIFYTGRIDEFFDFCFGALPYRSIHFEHEHLENTSRFQPTGTVNYPNEYDFTRITEFRHLTGQTHSGTSIVREYPSWSGDPYYPVPRKQNEELYIRYRTFAQSRDDITFIGRLAEYRYYNMDQVVARALHIIQEFLG